MATYYQRGESLDYTNAGAAAISAGAVVVYGDRIGVAGCDIAVGETGSIHVEGVFEMPLNDAAGMTAGAAVYWDGTGITATASTNTPAGYAAAAAAAGAETVLVKINA